MVGGYPATLAISNNDLVLTVVPEPATLTLLGSALLGLGFFYLRRRKARTMMRGLVVVVAVSSATANGQDIYVTNLNGRNTIGEYTISGAL